MGGGVVAEIGYIDPQTKRFVNYMLEWGYTARFAHYLFNPNNLNNEVFNTSELAVGEDMNGISLQDGYDAYAMQLHIGIQPKEVVQRDVVAVKLTVSEYNLNQPDSNYNNNQNQVPGGSWFCQLVVNDTYTYHNKDFIADNTIFTDIVAIIMKTPQMIQADFRNIPTINYCMMYGSCSSLKLINMADNPNLRYVICDTPKLSTTECGTHYYPSGKNTGSNVGLFGNCTSLIRSCFINYEDTSNCLGMYKNCQLMSKSSFPVISDWFYFDTQDVNLDNMFESIGDKVDGLSFSFGTNVKKINCRHMFGYSTMIQLPIFQILSDILESFDTYKMFYNLDTGNTSSPDRISNNDLFVRVTHAISMFENAKVNFGPYLKYLSLHNLLYGNAMFKGVQFYSSPAFTHHDFITLRDGCVINSMFAYCAITHMAFDLDGSAYMDSIFEGCTSFAMFKLRLNRDFSYDETMIANLFGGGSDGSLDIEPEVYIYNSGALPANIDPYRSIGFHVCKTLRLLQLGGIVNRQATDFVKIVKITKTPEFILNIHVHHAVIPRGIILFEPGNLTYPDRTTRLDFSMEPLIYNDNTENPFDGTPVPTSDYSGFIDWGSYTSATGARDVYVFLAGSTNWPDPHWDNVRNTWFRTDLFGVPANDPTFRPLSNINDIQDTWTAWPQKWIDDKR